MNFESAEKVRSVISTMKNVEVLRAQNRTVLNTFFNGDPPWTKKEADENGILINYNDKHGTNLLHQARNQYENAFGQTGSYCKVTVPSAPPEKARSFGTTITNHLNNVIRKSKPFYHTQDEVWGGVVLHGVGAKMWWDQFEWRPSFVGIQDILIPTDTSLTMENLRYYAVRRGMRPGQLFKKTLGRQEKNRDKGWKIKKVTEILDNFKELNTNPNNWNWSEQPEKMAELYKQNISYYDGDSAPMIWFWDFYFLEEESAPNKNGWYRRMLLDSDLAESGKTSAEPVAFVYDSSRPFANTLDSIIHFQFGDGNNVPPFKYHSIRSLAWLLYDLVWIGNRINCQFTQHVFEQLMILFRCQDPADRDRLSKLVLQGIVGLIPDGLNMVTAPERYQVDTNLVQGLQANIKQRIGESSSQYTQQIDNGTQKERTKFEVQAILSQTSALMASMLGRAYRQEYFAAVEICRRFTVKNSPNFDVKKFRKLCLDDGVDEQWLNSERWEIEIEQVLGSGNRMLQLAEATELMDRINMFDPNSQLEIKHDYVLAVTNNPKKAARLAPLDASPKVTDSIHDAQLAFGSLMLGVDMEPKEGLNHIEQVETLLAMMGQVIQRIESTDGIGTPQDLAGLQSVAKYIGKHIVIIAQDENEKARVKMYTDNLSKLMNLVRAFAQRQEEAAAEQGAQQDPELVAKLQGQMAELQQKLQAAEAKSQQQLAQKQQKHEQQMQIDADKARTQMTLDTGKAVAETAIAGMKAGASEKNGESKDQ